MNKIAENVRKTFESVLLKKRWMWCYIVVIELLFLMIVSLIYNKKEPVSLSYSQEDLIYNSGENGFYLDTTFGNKYITTPAFMLPRGIYRIEVQYENSQKRAATKIEIRYADEQIESDIGDIWYFDSNGVVLDVKVKYGNRPMQVRGRLTGDATPDDYILIRNINIASSPLDMRYFLFSVVLFFVVIDCLLLLYFKRKAIFYNKEVNAHFKILLLTIFISSLPLLVNYLLNGHDLRFHLMRIEGLKDGLLKGMLPVKIQPNWLGNHGYAVSVFYGDIFLYIPAVLRILGVPLQHAYQIYVLLINTATVFISYYCFSKMSNAKRGVVCAVIYSLNIYRLCNIYTRAAVGEYTAMTFMPLILYGMWKVYTLPEDSEEHRKSWRVITAGCTAVFLSHMISTEMAALFILITAIILYKKTFRKKTFLILCKAAATTVLLSLWFLIPFLDYMLNGTYIINSLDPYVAYKLEERGTFPAQFFMTDYAVVESGSVGAYQGVSFEMPLTIGLAGMAVIVGWFFLCFRKKERDKREKRQEYFVFFLCILSLYMTTYLFPYTWLAGKFSLLKLPFKSLQYPWRFFSISALMVTWLLCLILQKDWMEEKKKNIFAGLLICLAFGQGLSYVSKCLNESSAYRIYQGEGLTTFEIMGGEYLSVNKEENADINVNEYISKCTEAYIEQLSYEEDAVNVKDWHWDFDAVVVSLENKTEQIQQVEVPLLFYKGYQAVTDKNEKLQIQPGESYRISVSVPAHFTGNFQVKFCEPWYWRVCEFISLFTLLLIGGIGVIKRLGKRKEGQDAGNDKGSRAGAFKLSEVERFI